MKKKIIIGLSIFSLIFLLGGIYIITTIESATSKLDNLIKLHQVEILREQLLLHIERVQSDINLKNTRYAKNINTVIANVKIMEKMADTCFKCHHSATMQHRLSELKNDVEEYKKAISRVFTISANIQRLNTEEDRAYRKGAQLVTKVHNMISMASMKLESKTQSSLREITHTKTILYILVSLLPLLAGGLGFVFIRDFTKPVNVLLNATKRVKDGDLDYRIEGLKNEFGELASSFNEMSAVLKEHMFSIQESEKRYRMLFEGAGEGIFILDAEGENAGNIVSANQAAAEMHAYTVDELLELNIIKDLDSPYDASEAPARIQRILNGEWITAEINHCKKDGSVFPVEISAGLFEFMGHKYILAFDRDITERKKAEKAIIRSHIMFTTVLDSIDSIIYVADLETYEILYLNNYARNIFGDVEGKICWQTLQTDQSMPCNFCSNDKLLTPESVPTGVYKWEFKNTINGRWYDIRDRAIEWIDGRLVRMEIATDITDRKHADARSSEHMEFLQTLINTIPLPIYYKNRQGRYTGCNRAFKDFMGMPVEDIIGKTVYDLGPKKIAEKYDRKDRELFENPGTQVYEYKVQRESGDVRDVIFYKGTFADANKEISGLIGGILDITERNKMEENLRRSEQMKLIGEWAAGLAHEIKNSLAGIKISVEVLTEGPNISEEDRNSINRAIDEIKRIELLLKRTLNFARPTQLQFLPTDVNEILDNATGFAIQQSSVNPITRDKIYIIKDYYKNIPDTMADHLQLRQVFMNILINASESMPDGGTLTVKTSYDREAQIICIKISDTGEGIDAKIMKKVFKPFFTTKSKGSGLGLAITKRIVEQHGGSISAKNNHGGGALFSINIPVKPVVED